MDTTNPKSLISGYEQHLPTLTLPDENDRYVLAAAIEAKASVIVTFNLKDFPRRALSPYGIRALAPDVFWRPFSPRTRFDFSVVFDNTVPLWIALPKQRRSTFPRCGHRVSLQLQGG